MRKFLIAAPLALAAAATLATPASAASYTSSPAQVRKEIAQLDRQIDRAKERKTISWREARQLHNRVDQLEKLYVRYARNGFTRIELRVLDNRVDAVQRQLRIERHDNNDHRGPDTYKDGNRDGNRDAPRTGDDNRR